MDDKLPAPLPPPLRDLLWQEVARRLEAGAERSWLPMLSLEDERLLIHRPGVELGHLTLVSLDSALQA